MKPVTNRIVIIEAVAQAFVRESVGEKMIGADSETVKLFLLLTNWNWIILHFITMLKG